MEQMEWYATLIKPEWAPPAFLFGPVWAVLYAVIIVSFGYVVYLWWKRRIAFPAARPFLPNSVCNPACSPIQFGLENNLLAAVDILLVLATLVWALVSIWPRVRWVALANIPYLLWVSFATMLQFTITWLNW